MTSIDESLLRDRIQQVIQEEEGKASGELLVSYVLVSRTTVTDDPAASGFRFVYSESPISERLGLLRYGTIVTEADVRGIREVD